MHERRPPPRPSNTRKDQSHPRACSPARPCAVPRSANGRPILRPLAISAIGREIPTCVVGRGTADGRATRSPRRRGRARRLQRRDPMTREPDPGRAAYHHEPVMRREVVEPIERGARRGRCRRHRGRGRPRGGVAGLSPPDSCRGAGPRSLRPEGGSYPARRPEAPGDAAPRPLRLAPRAARRTGTRPDFWLPVRPRGQLAPTRPCRARVQLPAERSPGHAHGPDRRRHRGRHREPRRRGRPSRDAAEQCRRAPLSPHRASHRGRATLQHHNATRPGHR